VIGSRVKSMFDMRIEIVKSVFSNSCPICGCPVALAVRALDKNVNELIPTKQVWLFDATCQNCGNEFRLIMFSSNKLAEEWLRRHTNV
jgi:C4-type Zn-finger protein